MHVMIDNLRHAEIQWVNLIQAEPLQASQRLGGKKGHPNVKCDVLVQRHETWRNSTLVCEGLKNAQHKHQTPQIMLMSAKFEGPGKQFFSTKIHKFAKLEQY